MGTGMLISCRCVRKTVFTGLTVSEPNRQMAVSNCKITEPRTTLKHVSMAI